MLCQKEEIMNKRSKTDLNGIRNIIWDFNGTLLDDLQICLDTINQLLVKRNLEKLDKTRYLDIFTFPVKDYYAIAGIDFNRDPFEKIAIEYTDLYYEKADDSPLHKGTHEVLAHFREKGYRQIILSAMEQGELTRLTEKNDIARYFDYIFGISDHFGGGKLVLAEKAIVKSGFLPHQTCLVGDTLHDAEVAETLGISCILIADGHQSKERLEKSGHTVLNNLKELTEVLTR